jgi:2-(1,2-epoxy-1,2-dihydrophenyl)acetyl-CoA isomerase
MMTNQSLRIEIRDRILSLILNRPESLNSFDEEMLTGIITALGNAQSNPDIRVIIIRGQGALFVLAET